MTTVADHKTGTREEWLAARAELLRREKELTRLGDELARQRRELPWVPVETEYTFQTADGLKTLAELFDGCSQLVAYFNFDYGVSDAEWMRHDRDVPLLEANELALLKLLDAQPAVRENLPLIASQNATATGTNVDGYFSEGHGVSTFARDGDTVYHSYSSYARGTEFLMGYYAILDRTPKGRDEGDQAMHWLRRKDEYGSG